MRRLRGERLRTPVRRAYAKALAEEIVKPGIEAVTMFRNVQLRIKQSIGQDPWLTFPTLPAALLFLGG